MNKKWLAIGFVFICLILTGAGFGSGYQYRQTEIDSLLLKNKTLTSERTNWRQHAEFVDTELVRSEKRYTELQVKYFDMLDYSSNQTIELRELYDKYQELLKNPIIKEVIVDRYPTWKNFESIKQVESMFKGSVTPLLPNVCLDIAKDLQRSALDQGYRVSVALARNGYYYGVKVTDQPDGHAGLLLQAGDSWYFVDPLPWRVTKLW